MVTYKEILKEKLLATATVMIDMGFGEEMIISKLCSQLNYPRGLYEEKVLEKSRNENLSMSQTVDYMLTFCKN